MSQGIKYGLQLVAGPALGLIVYMSFGEAVAEPASRVAGIAIWMATWWILETVHLAVTALLPLVLFPALGVIPMEKVAPTYMNQVIFLFVGGFMLAIAMERWELHRRFALRILTTLGSSPNRLLLGFMGVCYFLSMWISNTATVMMLLPAVLAVIHQVEEQHGKPVTTLALGLLLGVAYAGSIGGTATLVGSPPNLIFQHFYESNFEAGAISFGRWFVFAFPLSLVFLGVVFWLLRLWFTNTLDVKQLNSSTLQEEYRQLGPVRFEEKVVAAVFVLTALLWFTRADLTIGTVTLPGWENLFPYEGHFHDGTVAMLMATLLFLLPARHPDRKRVLEWPDMSRLPLGIIFLFGGGFALAQGVETSGLTEWLAQQLSLLQGLSLVVILLGLCTFMTFTTELTSNTASTQLVMPVLIALSAGMSVHPLYIMLPVTFSASFAFMMPVATPPNTIIFGSERVDIPTMARVGIVLNVAGILLMTLAMLTWGRWLFGL
jgi:sodium-dependent dicarboxylate transporter 2/3/5